MKIKSIAVLLFLGNLLLNYSSFETSDKILPKILIMPIKNLSKVDNLSHSITKALKIEIARSSNFIILDNLTSEEISKFETEDLQKLKEETSKLELDYLITGAIKKQKEIELELNMIDVKKADIIAKAKVRQDIDKLGYKGDEKILQDEILRQVASSSIKKINSLISTIGYVEFAKENNEISISLGKDIGLNPQAIIKILKGGHAIAEAEVYKVNQFNSLAKVKSVEAGYSIAPNDKIRVIYNPEAKQKIKKDNTKKTKLKNIATYVGVIGGALLIAKANRDEDPKTTTPPQQQQQPPVKIKSIEVFCDPTNIPANGKSTSTITAIVKDENNNAVVDGTKVTFTTTEGMIIGVGTTKNGIATATLISDDTPGKATVTAIVGGLSSSTEITFTSLEILLSANKITLVGDGVSQSIITATVTDTAKNPVPDGTLVTFSIFPVNTGTITPYSITSGGIALATLTSKAMRPQESSITLTITASSGGAQGTLNIQFTPPVPPDVKVITLSANTDNAPADGTSEILISAEVKDVNHNKVADGTVVNFTTTLGVITASGITKGGVATTTVKSSVAGIATITASAGLTPINTSTNVTFTAQKIVVTPSLWSIPADGISTTLISAKLTNEPAGTPIVGVQVRFTTDNGVFSNVTITDANGVATAVLTSSTTPGRVSINAIYAATSKNLTITFTGDGISNIEVSCNPTSIIADGHSTSLVTAYVTDENGRPCADGTPINFAIDDPGAKITPATAFTINGYAIATVTASIHANRPLITATSGAISSFTQITFTSGSPAFIKLGADKLNIRGWDLVGNIANIRAEVYDNAHNPVSDGTEITFTTDGGKITKIVKTTNGTAVAELTGTGTFPQGVDATDFNIDFDQNGQPNLIGIATVTASTGDAVDTLHIVMSGEPISIVVKANGNTGTVTVKAALPPTNLSSVNATAELFDENGNPVIEGFNVTFTVENGAFPCPDDKTQFCPSWESKTSGSGYYLNTASATPLMFSGNGKITACYRNICGSVNIIGQ